MPISVKIIDDKYTLIDCEGDVSVDDLVKVNEYIYSDVDESVVKYQIVDITAVTNIVISTADIKRTADQEKKAAKSLGQITIAIVAVKDLDFGLSRAWEAYASTPGIKTMVFRDLVAAQEWLIGIRENSP